MKERQIDAMMSSRASSLLRKASAGFEPSAADKTKTRAAIARRVAVGVAAGAAVAAGAKSAAAAPSLAPAALVPAAVAAPSAAAGPVAAGFAGFGFATKLVAAVAIVGTVSAGAVTAHHRAATKTPPVVNVSVDTKVQQTAPLQMPLQQTAASPVSIDAPVTAAAQQPVVQRPIAQAPIESAPIANTLQNKPIQKIENDSPKPTAAPPALQTGAEVELFQRAQLALRANDATTALALLNEHAQRFPNGTFAEERDAARVVALCDAGRQADAAKLGAAFLSAHPNSPQASRVRSSCANDSAPTQ